MFLLTFKEQRYTVSGLDSYPVCFTLLKSLLPTMKVVTVHTSSHYSDPPMKDLCLPLELPTGKKKKKSRLSHRYNTSLLCVFPTP